MISLATKYRPSKLEDVVGQSVTVDILRYQIEKEILAGALGFFGASGCGKTTIARIVSNMINDNKGHPIEIDAASNNSVDDVRNIIEGASQRSLDSKYKVYIIDECFVPGSMISTPNGDIPIEEIKPKSKVASLTGFNTVRDVIKKQVPTSHLLTVNLSNGRKFVTTKNHLVFTSNGWVEAQNLIAGDELFDYTRMQKLWDDILQSNGQKSILQQPVSSGLSEKVKYANETESETDRENLSNMWKTLHSEHSIFSEKDLFQGLYANIYIGVKQDYSELRIWDGKTEVIFTKNEDEQSNESNRCNRKDEDYERIEWHSACMAGKTWGKWSIYRSTDEIISQFRQFLGVRTRGKYESPSKRKPGEISVCVQSRPWLQKSNDSCRGGWQFSSIEKAAVSRYKENNCFGTVRVDSIEVYKPGNIGKCRSSSEEYTTVYDLSVIGSPTYFVNSVLVHNCHAISSQGWQAFLKLLEEPNKYTKFIFCTTNPEKIPDTVISRLQTFTFTKISDEQIVDRLRYICRAEELELDDNSLKFITRISNGSMRQSIANLEKCTKTSKIVSYEEVVKIAGSSNYDLMIELFKAIYNKNDKIAVSIVENVYKSGKDLKLFVFEFLKFVLDLSKAKIFENNLSITSLPDTQQIRELFAFSSKFSEILENVVEFYESIRQSNEIRFMFESKLILWCAQN